MQPFIDMHTGWHKTYPAIAGRARWKPPNQLNPPSEAEVLRLGLHNIWKTFSG